MRLRYYRPEPEIPLPPSELPVRVPPDELPPPVEFQIG